MMLTSCPGCGGAAEVLDRFALPSTDGPVEHVRTYCVRRHWFLGPLTDTGAVPADEATRTRITATPTRNTTT
jgi:hypothetical protein